MQKLKVHNKITPIQAIIIMLFFVIITLLLVWNAYHDGLLTNHCPRVVSGCGVLIGGVITLFFILMDQLKLTKPYVSHLELTDTDLIIVRKNVSSGLDNEDIIDIGTEETITIPRNTISSIQAILYTVQIENRGKISYLNCRTEVRIMLADGESYVFDDVPSDGFNFCLYEFMLRFIKFAKQLPNFTYKVEGNWEVAKKDVDYYAQYGKRLSYLKRLAIVHNKTLLKRMVIFTICIILMIGICLYLINLCLIN